MHGSVVLKAFDIGGSGSFIDYANTKRRILFIEDPNNPYLIDLNMTYAQQGQFARAYFMNLYHVNSNNMPFTLENDDFALWSEIDGSTNDHLYMYVDNIEGLIRKTDYLTVFQDSVEEDFSLERIGIKRLSIIPYLDGGSPIYYRSTNVAFIKAIQGYTESELINSPQLLPNPAPFYTKPTDLSNSYTNQAYIWQHNNNTKDFFVSRSAEIYRDSNLRTEKVFTIEGLKLTLPIAEDYGFARLIKINGIWTLDQNYTHNLIPDIPIIYSNNTTLSQSQTFNTKNIYVANNVTLTIESTIYIGSIDIFLGTDAKIEVRNGGRLITDGTIFKRVDASQQHNGVRLYTANNLIENTTFEGGYYGLYMGTNSDNNIIKNSVFDGNSYGVYAYNSDGATIKGSTFEDSDGAAIWAYYSSLDVDPNVTSGQTRTTIKNNTGYGIVASNGSNVSVRNTTLTNITKHEFMVYSSGRMDLGYHSSGNTDHGKNVLSDAPNSTSDPIFYRYVYSTALTGSGETATQWTVPARKNFWHDGNAPSWVDFYGYVDYSNHLTSLPSGAAKIIAFNNVESTETGQNKLNQGFSNTQVDNSIRFSQSIQELKEEIASLQYDPRIGKLIRSYSGMVDASEKELMKEEIRELRQLKSKWLARYQHINEMAITDTLSADISNIDMDELDTSVPDTGLVKRISAVQTIGEVMLALEIRSAIDNENYGRVFRLVKEYDGRVRGKDLKFELISYLIKASIETQRNQLALRLVDRLEAMEPEEALLEDWIPLDFTSLRLDITDDGKAKGISFDDDDQLAQAFESDIYLDLGEVEEETVSEFKLYPAYPNPFNPSTTVTFDLPQQGKVRVDVFDISGRLVSILANQNYQQGNHRLVFDASGLASGVYLIRANIAGNVQTQRITLIK